MRLLGEEYVDWPASLLIHGDLEALPSPGDQASVGQSTSVKMSLELGVEATQTTSPVDFTLRGTVLSLWWDKDRFRMTRINTNT